MISNSIILCDDKDPSLGSYFERSATYASTLINLNGSLKKTELKSDKCNEIILDEIEFPKHNEKTLFIVCSHGSDKSFLKNGTVPFLMDTMKCSEGLDGGLIYSIACSTGKVFGKKIVSRNASFFGYDSEVQILPNHEGISIECDNYGLHKLIQGETLDSAMRQSKDKHTYYIDKLNWMDASKLRKTRDSIKVYGETSKSFF